MATLKLLALAFAASTAAREVHIYYGTDSGSGGLDGTGYATRGYTFYDGPPNCRDVGRGIRSISRGDVSSSMGIRIDGDDLENTPIEDWDIEEMEWHKRMNDDGEGMGHHTIRSKLRTSINSDLELTIRYSEADDYEIVPSDGGSPRGFCRRDNDHSFRCAVGAASSDVTGIRLFICDTDLEPIVGHEGTCNTKRCLIDSGYCDRGGC